ncbi:MAG: hypothetical protein HDS37_03385 [Bacteroides sp.]|nr:hypothetical protein [Bacteroides sp.]
MMNPKTYIRKIKAFLMAIVLLAFFAGGWILFVFSEISRQKEITREINSQTEEILDQMHRRDSAFTSELDKKSP